MNDKLQSVLADLAAKLGVAVPQLWHVYVNYQYSQAVAYLGTMTGILIVLIILAIVFKLPKIDGKMISVEDHRIPDRVGMAFLFSRAVLGIYSLIYVLCLPSLIVGVVSPEGAALASLLEKVGK